MATTTIRQQSSIPTTDHSCEGRNLLAATTATTKPKSHTIPRTQVDHSCEGRNLTTMCRQRRRILGGGMANCSTRHCEIPAYAGMVPGGTEVYGRIRHYRPPPNPSPNCRQPQTQIHQHTPIPPPDHSCVGRNLFFTSGNAAQFRRQSRPWLRDSCLRRNGPRRNRNVSANTKLSPPAAGIN